MTRDRVRWGFLSTAKIARTKVLPAFQQAPSCEVAAIASRDDDRARAVADDLGVDTAHGSYEALLADDGVDAVYIGLPNHLHREWTLAAAAAGKHVLCEKPLATTAADAQAMVEACHDAGVVLMEAFMYRLHPSWEQAVALVRDGTIGDLRAVQTRFAYYNDDPDNIRNIPEYGGGALYDIGCYAIDSARLLFGADPQRVVGAVHRDERFGTDVVAAAVLDFPAGTADFVVSTLTEPAQSVHVLGSNGRLEIEIPFNIPPDRPTRLHVTRGGTPPVDPATETVTIDPADQYAIEGERFARAVLDDAPPPVDPAGGVANLRVIESLLRG